MEVPEKFFLEKWQSVQLKCPSVQAQKAWRKVAVSTDGVPFSGPGKFWGKWQLREGFAENGSYEKVLWKMAVTRRFCGKWQLVMRRFCGKWQLREGFVENGKLLES